MIEMLIRLLICAVIFSGYVLFQRKRCPIQNQLKDFLGVSLVTVALLYLFVIGLLFANHADFPLNLNLMEGTVLQHVQRAVHGKEIYPEPTAEFVPFAYNPLYYYLSVPFVWFLGETLFTLRIVAIIGTFGILFTCGLILYRETKSLWWSLTGVGLIAASYRIMDAYLDTAHSDTWMIFCALLGTYLIGLGRNQRVDLIGVSILVASFWFKQHGALFALGGLVYLLYQNGLKKTLLFIFWVIIIGPGIYLLFGTTLFGSNFHYFTFEVPSRWSELNLETITRFIRYLIQFYPILTMLCITGLLLQGLRDLRTVDIWYFQYASALLSGFMGALDPGSADNVFIPMTVFTILAGTLSLYELSNIIIPRYKLRIVCGCLVFSYGLVVFNPYSLIVSKDAAQTYRDLLVVLKGLDGTVYAPTVGQLQSEYTLYPAAHWVALEDMVRGPGKDTRNHPLVMKTLEPIFHTKRTAYILENRPLKTFPWLRYLDDSFELKTDFGDRFKPLRCLPGRFDHLWPRYLYQLKKGKNNDAAVEDRNIGT